MSSSQSLITAVSRNLIPNATKHERSFGNSTPKRGKSVHEI